jgi:hypothetical protein
LKVLHCFNVLSVEFNVVLLILLCLIDCSFATNALLI